MHLDLVEHVHNLTEHVHNLAQHVHNLVEHVLNLPEHVYNLAEHVHNLAEYVHNHLLVFISVVTPFLTSITYTVHPLFLWPSSLILKTFLGASLMACSYYDNRLSHNFSVTKVHSLFPLFLDYCDCEPILQGVNPSTRSPISFWGCRAVVSTVNINTHDTIIP